MRTLFKSMIAGALGIVAFASASAFAGQTSDYDPYRGSGVSFSVSFNDGYHKAHYDRGRRHHRRGDRRVVYRDVFQTRYRARIVLIEEVVHRRKGSRLVCTVEARGPEAGYVSKRRLNRIANRNCSPRARIRVFA